MDGELFFLPSRVLARCRWFREECGNGEWCFFFRELATLILDSVWIFILWWGCKSGECACSFLLLSILTEYFSCFDTTWYYFYNNQQYVAYMYLITYSYWHSFKKWLLKDDAQWKVLTIYESSRRCILLRDWHFMYSFLCKHIEVAFGLNWNINQRKVLLVVTIGPMDAT